MIIIIAAHIPIFTLQRHEGRIFSPMAWTVTSALVGSLVLSLTLVPLLCAQLLKKNVAHGDNRAGRVAQGALRAACCDGRSRNAPRFADRRGAWRCSRQSAARHAARQRVPARAERGHDLGEPHAAAVGVARGGAGAGARSARSALHTVPEVRTVISQGRPPRRRHRSEDLQLRRALRRLRPGGAVARAARPRTTSSARWMPRVSAHPGHGAVVLAADPRQRAGEHLAGRRPDRDQGARRRPRPASTPRRGEILRRSRRCRAWCAPSSTATARCRSTLIDIDRAARGALRHQRGRRAGPHRDGARRQGDLRAVGRREALQRRGAPEAAASASWRAAEAAGRRRPTARRCRSRSSRASARCPAR